MTDCNCSICLRLGVLWAYYKQGDVEVLAQPGAISSYRWGDRTIDFCRCTQCGCTTHYLSVQRGAAERIAINARCWPLGTIDRVPVRHFDGAAM